MAGPPTSGGDRLDDLLDLAEHSLIVPSPAPPGRMRFRLLRTIGSFALERLAAVGSRDGGPSAPCRGLPRPRRTRSSRTSGRRSTANGSTAIGRTRPTCGRPRAGRSTRGRDELALRLTGSSWRIWHAFGQVADGRAMTERALAMPDAPTSGSARAWAEGAAGSYAYWQADPAAARRHYEAQVALATAADDEAATADAYFNLGHMLYIEGDAGLHREFVDGVVGRYRDLGDERGMARANWSLAIIAMGLGETDVAAAELTKSLAEFDRLDDRQYHAMTSASLSWTAFAHGDVADGLPSGRRGAGRDAGDARPRDHDHLAARRGADGRHARSLRGRGPAARGLRRAVRPVRGPAAGGPRGVHRRAGPVPGGAGDARTGDLCGASTRTGGG